MKHSFVLYSPNIELHELFKRRCNAFFMEVVYTLSFSSNAPPDSEVISKLMGYVICDANDKIHTRRLTLFNDGVDPTPVLRSFLLKMLLQYRLEFKCFSIAVEH